MSKIGPTFPNELVAAGIALEGVSWDPGSGLILSAPGAVADQVAAVLAAHDPTRSTASVDVPASVMDYQFAGQAYAEGIIDFEAAKAWTGSGVVPKVLLDAIDAVVADPERHARVVLFLMGTKEFPRNHELTPILAASFGKDTPEKLDAFFVAAGRR